MTAKGKSLLSFFVADGNTGVGPAGDTPDDAAGKGFRALLPETSLASSCMCGFYYPYLASRSFVSQRHAHRRAHVFHGFAGHVAGAFGARLQNIPRQPRILLKFLASLLHRTQQV